MTLQHEKTICLQLQSFLGNPHMQLKLSGSLQIQMLTFWQRF